VVEAKLLPYMKNLVIAIENNALNRRVSDLPLTVAVDGNGSGEYYVYDVDNVEVRCRLKYFKNHSIAD